MANAIDEAARELVCRWMPCSTRTDKSDGSTLVIAHCPMCDTLTVAIAAALRAQFEAGARAMQQTACVVLGGESDVARAQATLEMKRRRREHENQWRAVSGSLRRAADRIEALPVAASESAQLADLMRDPPAPTPRLVAAMRRGDGTIAGAIAWAARRARRFAKKPTSHPPEAGR